MRFPRIEFLFVLAVFGVTFAHAQSRIDCHAVHSQILRQNIRYCVYLPEGYDAAAKQGRQYPLLYFLHGLGDNEQTLFNSGGWTLLDDLRKQHKIGEFLIVAPEGRRSFFINSASGKFRYSDFFIREFIPYMDKHYSVVRSHSGRAISGISMGGYGALRFAFAYPELFSAVSAQSPALITETPQQLNSAANSGMPIVNVLIPVFGDPINLAHWDRNDPFLLVRKDSTQLRHMAIYFNCGSEDNYGFERGAEKLDRELRAENIKHVFHLYPGDHSISYFLSHFAEVMEFHSGAFGLNK